MNRIILIGNGFDLAHELPTSYGSFIDWYWEQWLNLLKQSISYKKNDLLCNFILNYSSTTWKEFLETKVNPKSKITAKHFFDNLKKDFSITINSSELFLEITKSIETKGWVDIENDYYKLLKYSYDRSRYERPKIESLNIQLCFLREKLIEYLNSIDIDKRMRKDKIEKIIFSPINYKDISVTDANKLVEHIQRCLSCTDSEFKMKMGLYKIGKDLEIKLLNDLRNEQRDDTEYAIRQSIMINNYPREFFLPDEILFLNFNYTNTTKLYLPVPKPGFEINHIHGELSKPESIIFGYGDELDENYKKISNLNDNEYLTNFKSIKYLESDRYRRALQFMDAAPYQVFIMGHSCGNSDRTLLNTLFEHKNCVSIKPYYYKDGDKDNYLEIVQNISRNFKDMKLMRDRVVNKTYCEPFSERVS